MRLIEKMKWWASGFNRRRKIKYIMRNVSDDETIIDVGVSPVSAIPTDHTNYINEYFLGLGRPIAALGLASEDFSFFRHYYTNCTLHLFDGRNFPNFEKKYDIALCNAVIEHVGTREEQLQWLIGLRSICNRLIITTPNRYFPVESHTNTVLKHIFSSKYKERLLSSNINLFSLREFMNLLSAAGFHIVAIKKNKLLFFNIDFVLTCD